MPLEDIIGHVFDRRLDLLERFHLIEITGLEFTLFAVGGIDAVVDRHIEDNTETDRGMRGMHAVGRRIVVAGTDNFLAADKAVITGIFEFKTEFAYDCRNDDLVILVQGQAAYALGRLNSAFPKLVRRVFVDTQRDGGVVEH